MHVYHHLHLFRVDLFTLQRYYLYRCRLHHLWHHGPQTVQVMCFL